MTAKTRRILLIHSNNDLKDMLLICLESISNYEIIMAESGKEGIEKSLEVDAILLDVDETMPDLCWQEIINGLKKNLVTNSVPLVLLTSIPQSPEILEFQQTRELKIRAIAKTFDFLNLVNQISALLDQDQLN